MQDAFSTLGLKADTASTADVKEAYRALGTRTSLPASLSVCALLNGVFSGCCAAKKHHPDVNPDDDGAAERFKRMTAAYTQALLISARRERAKGSGQSVHDSPPQGSAPRAPRQRYSSPRTAAGPVNEKRFNVREWDYMHYGLKGATAEDRQSQYIRQLHRQQRGQEQSAARAAASASSRGGQRASASGASSAAIAISIAACASVWSAVYSTNFGRYRSR
jgi:hypothetical protein